jgi:transposase
MAHFAGLDVSLRATSICIVDEDGRVVRESKVASEPAALLAALRGHAATLRRVGLEAGPLSQWLYGALVEAGLPAVCVETRHMKAALSAQVNKTDRNDARGIAQMMRVGLYRPVHVKTPESQQRRMLLVGRKLLQAKVRAVENDLRGSLRTFGLKVGHTSAGGFDRRVRDLVEGMPPVAAAAAALLEARRVLLAQLKVLHRMLVGLAAEDPVCRRLMTVPGVGPVVAVTFQATVDRPERFPRSRAVGAHLGLAPRKHSSGETDYTGRISKCGDPLTRAALYGPRHCLGRPHAAHPHAAMVRPEGLGRPSAWRSAAASSVRWSRSLAASP